MAVTASVAVSPSSVVAEQLATVTLTVSNSGGAALSVLSVKPTAVDANGLNSVAVAHGLPPLGPGLTTSVAGGGSLALQYGILAHAPASGLGLAEPASSVYTLGAVVVMSDGSTVNASTATLTATPPSH